MRTFPAKDIPEFSLLRRLDDARKIQDFLDSMSINFEVGKETCRSPLCVLRANESHCMEGALLAAAALWMTGEKPFIMDLKTSDRDVDHVVALFRRNGLWGAISKTNHAVLRYRDPIYKTPREIAMSYFNEYFLDDGTKTLRSFSAPFDMSQLPDSWLTSKRNLWAVSEALDHSPHFPIVTAREARFLRPADTIEIETGKVTQWRLEDGTARKVY